MDPNGDTVLILRPLPYFIKHFLYVIIVISELCPLYLCASKDILEYFQVGAQCLFLRLHFWYRYQYKFVKCLS